MLFSDEVGVFVFFSECIQECHLSPKAGVTDHLYDASFLHRQDSYSRQMIIAGLSSLVENGLPIFRVLVNAAASLFLVFLQTLRVINRQEMLWLVASLSY